MIGRRPAWILAIAAVAVALAGNLAVPVLDEELWLDIAAQLDPARPYDWFHAMQPWGEARGGDSYLFAHPPLFSLWVWLWSHLTEDVSRQRWLCGLPVAALWGWAVGRLAQRWTRAPLLAGGLWLSLPVVGMALQRGLMPDGLVVALATTALALWLAPGRRAWVLGGLALGLAIETKYPAAILGLALLGHAVLLGNVRERLPFFIAALAPVLLVEGALVAVYGRVHLIEVLGHAGEIARGPVGGRWLGVLARLPLVAPVLLLLAPGLRSSWVGGFLLGGGALALGWPGELGAEARLALLGWAAAGGAALALMLQCSKSGRMSQCSIAEPERRLLAGLALGVIIGVVLGHNYAAPRYLALAAAPLALLVAASVRGRGWVVAAIVVQAGLSVQIGLAEARYARAAEAVAQAAATAFPGGGTFTGEWTFRWVLRRAGWRWGLEPEAGGVFVSPVQAPHGAVPEGMHELARYRVAGAGVRLLDGGAGVGLYAETLGPVPLGWGLAPVEEAVIFVGGR